MDPSHRITFTPTHGTALVYLVRLIAHDHRRLHYQDQVPRSPEEWWSWTRDFRAASLLASSNGWSCAGGPTPHWRPGTVQVEPLIPGWGPTAAAWEHCWPPRGLATTSG